MRSLRFHALVVPASLLLFGCDARLDSDGPTSPVGVSAALDAPGEGASLANQVCLPVSAFGSDIDLIDACMDCEEGDPCTLEQIDAGCCGPAAPPPATPPEPPAPPASSPDPGAALGGGVLGGILNLEPSPPPIRSSPGG